MVRTHKKTWRAARVMAWESGAAPAPPRSTRPRTLRRPAAADGGGSCLGHPAPGRTGVSAVLRPACCRQGARPAARRGVGEASGSVGDSWLRGGAGGGATGKGALYFLLCCRGCQAPLPIV